MTSTAPVVTLSPRDYDAVLFDLDGVLTKTASVHAAAWKRLFDGFLEQRAAATGEPFVSFDIDGDYRRYVDGKPRYDGVASFLKSRGIELPFGAVEDTAGAQTVRGLGKLKDQYFTEQLRQEGVEVYEAAIALVRSLRAQEIKTAVVSSSNNCAADLRQQGYRSSLTSGWTASISPAMASRVSRRRTLFSKLRGGSMPSRRARL
jgi:beta-phosphoglucomutase-like phosphatase (HAD superfamily)